MRKILACPLILIPGAALALEPVGGPPKPTPTPEHALRVQKVGDVTYFHVSLETPRDLATDGSQAGEFVPAPGPSLTPRLVSTDGRASMVCQRTNLSGPGRFPAPGDLLAPTPPGWQAEDMPQKVEKGEPAPKGPPRVQAKGRANPRAPRQPVPVMGLEFVGRLGAASEAKFKLLYPVAFRPRTHIGRLLNASRTLVWKEVELTFDFAKAEEVPVPEEAAERKEQQTRTGGAPFRNPPVRDDLEGLWAVARVEQFQERAGEATEFGFYDFAAASTARRYGVQGPTEFAGRTGRPARGGRIGGPGELLDHELYETTTGAAAITESLQLRRVNGVRQPHTEARNVPVDKIQGIDVAEHPWEKMMGDHRPAPEEFARMVPRDNYYVRFNNVARFVEFSALLDQWGTNLIRAYELTSRDYRLKQRYEQQLCLRSTELGKLLGPIVIKGIAVTGNDAYLREGSDVAVLFHVLDRRVFLAAVEPFLAEARRKFAGNLAEAKADYHGVNVESFVTPLREVSLYRASLGDIVVYANSPAGIRRVLDVAAGRGKSLADSPDFQYMRTVFRSDDPEEDGFAFLSDPFIRNLVGPASKIKEKRRLEALTSLNTLTYAALLSRWESGKEPPSAADVLRATGLRADEIPMPEGQPASWDAAERSAVSDVYGTNRFATPLVELPIDKVTPTESAEYNRFRMEYLGLWRQYFDPIGMRVSLRDGRVKLDTYILPLIENSAYNRLRAITGKGTVRLDPARLSPKTLAQYMMHLSTDAEERGGWFGAIGPRGGLEEFGLWSMLAWAADPVGEWFLVRADDSPNYERLVKLAERSDNGEPVDIEEVARLIWTLPVAVGVDVKNPLTLTAGLTALRAAALASLPGALTWAPLAQEYKGVSIVRVRATPAGRQMLGPLAGPPRRGRANAFLPAIYYAMLDGGLFLTLNEEMMHELIDDALARKEGGPNTVEVNTSLYVAPAAAEHTKGLLKHYLESQTHQRAIQNLSVWYALYHSGVVTEDAPLDRAAVAAYCSLGFVPVSPDGTVYRYVRAHDEVTNERHGSHRVPVLNKTTADNSPLNRLLETLRSVRADLRFREDGIHTVLTLDRAAAAE
jgi:hypothetical protein